MSADPETAVEVCQSFLELLYGQSYTTGYLTLFTVDSERTYWHPSANLAEAAAQAVELSSVTDVYAGVGLRGKRLLRGRGGSQDVVAIPGIWIDLDIAGPAHKQTNLPRNRGEVLALLRELPVRPSLVVDSGHGLYAFWLFHELWVFESDAERQEAQVLVQRVQMLVRQRAKARGWFFEPTADLARVLRLPGTVNRKSEPIEVRYTVHPSHRRYAVEDFEDVLPDLPVEMRSIPKDRDETFDANLDPILNGCAFVSHCRDDAKDLPEPSWYAMMTIVGRTNDGTNTIHDWSMPYSSYSELETDAKVKHALTDTGPYTCRYIHDMLGFTGCETCEHWGKIKSPVVLGRPKPASIRLVEKHAEAERKGAEEPEGTTDTGNGLRFKRMFGDRCRWCEPFSSWYVFDGRRWAPDATLEVHRLAKRVVRAMYREAETIDDAAGRKDLARHAMRSESMAKIKAMLEAARSELAIEPGEFDTDPMRFNVLNGTINLITGDLEPHCREDYITKIAPVIYDPTAKSRSWQDFLDDVTELDSEVQDFLQRAAGYSLTGDTREEKLFFIHGPTNSGKSTFLEAIKRTLGDYAATADFETFLQRRDVGAARPDIARLAGVRLVASIEVDDGKKLAEGLIKMLTGGDTVTARRLYQDEFEFKPFFKLWLAANHAPRVADDDDAMWRRILRVPFEYTVPVEKRDPRVKEGLIDTLVSGPAILAWLVAGCLKWQQNGLTNPSRIVEATRQYRDDMDPISGFIEDYCVTDSEAWTSSKALRTAYEEWGKEEGVTKHLLGGRAFGERLRARGCTPKPAWVQGKQARGWLGIGLRGAESQHTFTKIL